MKRLQILTLSALILLISCSKKDDNVIDPTTNDKVNYFIWRGLGTFYLWQKEVPDLADNRFANFDDLYTYFRGFNTPENTFSNLLYNFGTVDRFSWIVDDYIALENSFQGVNLSNGMEFGLVRYENNDNNLFGYIRYVVPNSDASNIGLTRGLLFNKVNGQQLTISNYEGLLFDNSLSYSIELADFNNGNPISNNTVYTLSKSQIEENPIKINKVFTEGSTKIGYLIYNQFARNYDGQLNSVFGTFKAENIDELIVDLRYNPGGSSNTATYLGGMITGQFTGELFSQEVWNDKVTNAWSPERFVNNFTGEIRNVDANGNVILQQSINSLGLNKVHFIVTRSSASASELVINSLSSYIDVRLVGTKTVGKQVGSVTLYDSDNFSRSGDNLSTEHFYAMQPLVFEISNKDNLNYPNGITPGITLPGIELGEDYGNLGELGDRNEPLLSRTIQYILTGSKGFTKQKSFRSEEIYNSKLATPASDNMYIDLKDRNFLKID